MNTHDQTPAFLSEEPRSIQSASQSPDIREPDTELDRLADDGAPLHRRPEDD